MSTIQDHADAVLAKLVADSSLTVYDGAVGGGAPDHYVMVRIYRMRPDGLAAPDKIALTGLSTAVDMRAYCHCVGGNATAARAVAGRVEAALLDVTLTVPARSCSPVRLVDSSPPMRDEESGPLVVELTDIYGFTSVPG